MMCRVAVVTGGASGIGGAISRQLMAAGYEVWIHDLQEYTDDVPLNGGGLVSWVGNATDPSDVEKFYTSLKKDRGRVDVLINNVSVALRQSTIDIEYLDWQNVINCNINSLFYHSKSAGRIMMKNQSGSIVNIASIMGMRGGELYPNLAYHATKAATINMTRALALEWAESGIRVNAVAPGFVRTRLTEKLLAEGLMEQEIIKRTPMARLVEAEEVANLVKFLVSNEAQMITGQTIPVDGGWTAK